MNLVIFFSKGSIEILSCLLFVLLLLSPGVLDECDSSPRNRICGTVRLNLPGYFYNLSSADTAWVEYSYHSLWLLQV